ncbi:hypothetical protein AVEN_187906-1 [Araneus ventricosus]|uniref:Uncharacterized protein n=1 Tax=Araneus ventricosus TaxID=182803 RepID=A0A4Y2CU44_ARAVE|nr:hypothetical protein AVEN_187906-1 [Araneus ventricosus]
MVSLLQLPRELEKRVAIFSEFACIERSIWNRGLVKLHSKIVPGCLCLEQVDILPNVQWHLIGGVNVKEAEILVQNERLDVHFRFVLSCYFCFENDVISLWEIMPEDTKIDIRSNTCISQPFVSYWLKWLDNAVTESDKSLIAYFPEDGCYDYFLNNECLIDYISRKIRNVPDLEDLDSIVEFEEDLSF